MPIGSNTATDVNGLPCMKQRIKGLFAGGVLALVLFALIGISLAGCMTTNTPTPEIRAEADCLKRAAAELDDGYSDAIAVAVGVVAAAAP